MYNAFKRPKFCYFGEKILRNYSIKHINHLSNLKIQTFCFVFEFIYVQYINRI